LLARHIGIRAMIALADDSSSHASDTPGLDVKFDRDPQAPAHARAAVARFTAASGISGLALDTLTLLVSELVSNAVLHSDAPSASGILLSARVVERRTIRVEVTDGGSGFTAVPRDPSRVTGGYGLFLVAQQASRWGVDREGGTRVWFELTRS
jgi:anti-sigma regulatory factor (Ser/Thr protein kinase)